MENKKNRTVYIIHSDYKATQKYRTRQFFGAFALGLFFGGAVGFFLGLLTGLMSR